ncbi:hypothetical protein GN958_ATG10266 [Phytophthora infestans]|uniref:Uncharacterized protein n=1 Tax=Phytophthora infestans TaxID=4787 RepID=A0A8S9UM20_PHYIN|nr:hypothetical protein GN958_ATG10266 [Phytophthora infestans]
MPPDLPAHEGHSSLLASLGMCTGELPPPFLGTESAASTRTPSILSTARPQLSWILQNQLRLQLLQRQSVRLRQNGKATEEAKSQVKRVKWTNKMVGELLRLRFSDGDVKRRLESADTKTKTALAWQYFASVLSQELGMVLNRDQVSLKYRKLRCVYRISGDVLLDSAIDEDNDEGMEVDGTQATEEVSKQKPAPVAQLVTALQGEMEATEREAQVPGDAVASSS